MLMKINYEGDERSSFTQHITVVCACARTYEDTTRKILLIRIIEHAHCCGVRACTCRQVSVRANG